MEEFIREVFDKLPFAEADAWAEAYIEDLERGKSVAERELAYSEEILAIIREYHGFENAFEGIMKSPKRTAAEFRFLKAYNHLKRSGHPEVVNSPPEFLKIYLSLFT